MKRPIRYLSRAEFADRIGVVAGALTRYKLPPPDALTGTTRGWKPETVDRWHAARPGSGWRKGQGKKPKTRKRDADEPQLGATAWGYVDGKQ